MAIDKAELIIALKFLIKAEWQDIEATKAIACQQTPEEIAAAEQQLRDEKYQFIENKFGLSAGTVASATLQQIKTFFNNYINNHRTKIVEYVGNVDNWKANKIAELQSDTKDNWIELIVRILIWFNQN